jgi:hypothetical protein
VRREEIVRAIRATATARSSVPELLSCVFPGVSLQWHVARVLVDGLVATEIQLERDKYRLVEALFPDAESFERLDRELFPGFPLTGVSLGDGRIGVIDGHHRVRRFCELASPSATLEMKIMSTNSPDVRESYLRQVQMVEEVNGGATFLDLPIKP